MKHFVVYRNYNSICAAFIENLFKNLSYVIFTLWIRSRIQLELDSDLDPDPYYKVCGSETMFGVFDTTK